MNRDHSFIFEIPYKYCIFDSFVDYEGYSISFKGLLPIVVDTMVIWIKFTHSHLLWSTDPKMSMFNLTISCLTTSNLPWFMDLTFLVPMPYCSSPHLTLLLPPDTSATGHNFCFESASSFFLKLFLCSSPVAYWTTSSLGLKFQCQIFLPFYTVNGVLKARLLMWFGISFSSGPRFVRWLK